MLLLFAGEDAVRETFRFQEEKLGTGSFIFHITSGEFFWSNGIFTLLGLTAGSVEPSVVHLRRMVHPEDRAPAGAYDNTVPVGLPVNRDFRIIHRNGRIRWLRSHAELLMGADGKPERVIGVFADITDKAEADRRAHAAALIWKTQAKAARCVTWVARPDGSVAVIPGWEARGGPDSTQMLDRGWLNFIHPADREATATAWRESIATGGLYSIDNRVLQPDGTYRWKRSRALPILSSSGEVLDWAGVTFDIEEAAPVDGPEEISRVTGAQLRSARGALKWSVRDLSTKANISTAVLRRLEQFDGQISGSRDAAAAAKTALQEAGAEFLTFSRGKPGVRLR